MQHVSNILAHLDTLVSLAAACTSAPMDYVRPKIHPKGESKLKSLVMLFLVSSVS